MKQTNQSKVQVDPTTGEVYIRYPRAGKVKSGRMPRLVRWLNAKLDNHFKRLAVLRVYGDRWYDYRVQK